MTATPAPAQEAQATPKEALTKKMRRYAQLENIIATVMQDQQVKVQAITTATKDALRPHERELADLEAEILQYVTTHRPALYPPKSKTLDMDTHVISFRKSQAIEVDDEENTIAVIQAAVEDEDNSETHRMAAAACLNYGKPKLDRTFIGKNWARHHDWFTGYFGLRRVKKETPAIKAKAIPEADT